MIDPKELRIGNLLQANGHTLVVKKITDEWVTCIMKESGLEWCPSPGILDPIPLTPEWLERCGFEYDNIVHSLGPIWLAEGRSDYYDVFLAGLSGGITTHLKYLHQLMNLFYALTGQEIAISEERKDHFIQESGTFTQEALDKLGEKCKEP